MKTLQIEALLTMSWVLPVAVLCEILALFAAGELGEADGAFRFPLVYTGRHNIPARDRVVWGRDRNGGREDIGEVHEVTRKHEEICTQYSEEYDDRTEALLCNEEYMRLAHEEIERSNCTNEFYKHDAELENMDSCDISDEGVNVSLCSELCSWKQFIYVYCKSVGKTRLNIDRECGLPAVGAGVCSFNNEQFCIIEILDPSSNLRRVYNECFVNSNVNEGSCSDDCREAVESWKDLQGCCVQFFFQFDYSFSTIFDLDGSEKSVLSSGLFSTCEVKPPKACDSFSPPEEFVDCAHDGEVHVSPTVFYSTVLIIVSLLNAM